MPTIAEVRQKYPQYSDMSDDQLADALHSKFYSDMPREEFNTKIGLAQQPQQEKPGNIMDFFKSIPGGALGGISSALSAGGRAAQAEMSQEIDVPGAEQTKGILEKNVTGELHKPQTRGGRFGETVGEFMGNPATYVGPAGLGMKAATGVTSALTSEAAGQATEGTKAETIARMIGALVGGHIPKKAPEVNVPKGKAPKVEAAPIPSLEETFASSNSHYEQLREMAVPLRRDVVANLSDGIINKLEDLSFFREDQPRTFRSIERLINKEGGSSSKEVYAARTALNRVIQDLPGSSEAEAARKAIEQLDTYLSNIPGFAETALKARKDWSAAKTSQMVQEAETKAQRAAAASGSGANIDNATRQQIKSILNDKKKVSRLSAEEKELAEEIVRGGKIGNLARVLSKLGPKHPLTGWGMALAADFSGGAGTATGTLGVGAIAQWLAEKGTTGKVRRLDEMIRSRSDLAGPQPPKQAPILSKRLVDWQSELLGSYGGISSVIDRRGAP